MFISHDEAMLYSVSFGPRSAPPILAVSGWIGSWEDWADTLSALSENWRTLSFDHRGSGATVAPIGSITFENLVEDVFAVLDAYEIEHCVLAAMSMGAAIALSLAARHPERFSGLVVVNGVYFREVSLAEDAFYQVLLANYSAALDRFVEACVPERDSEPIKRWGRQILDRATPEAALALYRLGASLDLRHKLTRISLPVLVLHGDADPLVTVASSRWLASALPQGELVLIEGAGHVPIMTRPDTVAAEITRFFRIQERV